MSLKNLSVKTKIPKLLQKKLNNKKVKKIYEIFERSISIDENFGVAVSGGPDSLALAFLSKIYALKKGLSVFFFIIDHKLRRESTSEAIKVKKILKKIYINAEILTWYGKKPNKNIQSIARKKRHELLFRKSKKIGINNIFLGHHQGDLFENFFIRILRGSGLKGLISLDKNNKIGNVNIFRPLLNQRKADLIFISRYVFNFYVKDPTNDDEKFQRIRIRKLLDQLEKDGLDEKKFATTIKNLKHSDNVIEFYIKENLKKNSFFSNKKKQLILNNKFFDQPYEVVFRSFSQSLKIVGKKFYPSRGKKIERVIYNIKKGSFFKATLGGCMIEKVSQTVIISKEG